jgi:hypothetical protein
VAINGGAGAVWSPGHCGPWPDDELSRMRRVTEMVPRDAPDHLLRLAMLSAASATWTSSSASASCAAWA